MHRLALFVLLLLASIASAAQPSYVKEDVMLPMRDGLRLHAVILRPAPHAPHADEMLPILLNRTPYGVSSMTPAQFVERYPEFAAAGYIFVHEDIRGRYRSEGTFVMMRPLAPHHDPKLYPRDVDESTDAYDTVSWLVRHVARNNGRVGVLGVSYDGFLTAMAGIDPHPAVKAISPQAPMTDVWQGDDFFHNGAFRETYGYDYALGMESGKENAFAKLDRDAYDFFLDAVSFTGAIRQSGATQNGATLPTWAAFLAHPADDEYWQRRAVQPHLDRVAVPTLEVGGWWDQEDMWGPQAEYAALKPHDSRGEVLIALGPWNHGQWRGAARTLGVLDFGQATGTAYRTQVEEPFFEHYLRPERGLPLPEGTAISFQTGTNRWMHYDAWPPANNVQTQALYLGAAQSLGFRKPAESGAADEDKSTAYPADPAHPVPYRARPIEATYAPTGSHWYTWLVEDQRQFTSRADVASWQTSVLEHDLTVTGEIVADLFASTTGTDSDWVVKLIDVYPDGPEQGKMAGYQLMIADEIFRGRYRESAATAKPVPAGQVEEYKFSLHGADHVFLKGHRVMVQVQSSWFPLYDRNPQTFVVNIMQAGLQDYAAATQRIWWSPQYPSHLDLPVAASQ